MVVIMQDITYTWKITNLVRHAATDMIFSIEWELVAVLGLNLVSANGSINLEPSENPIPFIDLSPELITDWLMDALGPENQKEIEDGLAEALNAQANPTVLSGMPW